MPHFSAFAAETPDRPAYIMANTGQVVTYAELDRRSNQVAHLLRASGVRRGDHIAMMMKNCAGGDGLHHHQLQGEAVYCLGVSGRGGN